MCNAAVDSRESNFVRRIDGKVRIEHVWSQTHHARIRNDLSKVFTVTTNNEADRVAFKISNRGELLFPPPIAQLIPQALPLEKLTKSQTVLWQAANAAEFRDTDPEIAIQAYQEFMATHPSEEFLSRAS